MPDFCPVLLLRVPMAAGLLMLPMRGFSPTAAVDVMAALL